MKKIYLIMLVLGASILTGCTSPNNISGTGTNQEVTTTIYENKEYKFTLDFPTKRTFKENVYGSIVMFFSPETTKDTTRENLGISVQNIAGTGNLEQIYQENKKLFLANIANSKIVKEEDITINKQTAKEITYTFTQGDYDIKETQYLLINGKSAYIFTYTALQKTFNTYKNDADAIVQSFTLK